MKLFERRKDGHSAHIEAYSCKKTEGCSSSCGTSSCPSCAFPAKLWVSSMQWMRRAGDASKSRFLSGLLLRCRSVSVLQRIHNVLQVTSGKDFTYTRSKKPSSPEDAGWSSWERAAPPPHAEPLGTEVLRVWDWFRSDTPDWIRATYLLHALRLCDPEVLRMLGNLTSVLLAREKRALMQSTDEKEDTFIPGSSHSFSPDDDDDDDDDDHPHLDLLRQASAAFHPEGECSGADVARSNELPEKSSHNSEISRRSGRLCAPPGPFAVFGGGGGGGGLSHKKKEGERGGDHSETDSSDWDEPALTVVPGSSASLSGVRRHCDFLRRLPVHLAKRILGQLDKATLRCCRDVSLHWRYLAEETVEDTKTQTLLRNQVMIMQSNSNNWWVSDVFASMVNVPVPMEHDDQEQEDLSIVQKDRPFKAVYSDIRTKMVEMEERNVYCGVYNVRVLLEKEDPYRTADYRGGALVALGSRDRLVRLLHATATKKAPTHMKGHAGSVRALLLCEDRDMVVSAGYDLNIRCWDMRTKECVMLLSGHTGTITCLDQQGDTLVSGAKDCKVKVWNLQTGRCHEELKFRHANCVRCVKIHTLMLYSSCDRGLIKTWDLHHGSLLRVINVHQRPVKCLYLDQWHLVSGDSDGQVMAWSTNCDAKHCLNTFSHPREVRCVTLSFLRVITGCMDGKIRIFHFLTGDCLRVLKTPGPILSMHCHGFNVLVNTTSSVQLYQFATVQWDYTASPRGGQRGCYTNAQAVVEKAALAPERESAASLRMSPRHGFARWARPPDPKIPDLHGKKKERPPQPTRRVRFLSACGSVRRGEEPSQRPVSCSGLQPQLMRKPPSAIYPGRPVRWRSQESLTQTNRTSHTPCITNIGSAREELGRAPKTPWALSESAACERVKKRGPHRPLTTQQIVLRVNAVRQGQLMDEAGLNMELNGRLRDAWGFPASPPPPPPDPPEPTTNATTACPTLNRNSPRTQKRPPPPPPQLVFSDHVSTRSFGKNRRSTLHGMMAVPSTAPVLRATPHPRTGGDGLREHRPSCTDSEKTRPLTQPPAARTVCFATGAEKAALGPGVTFERAGSSSSSRRPPAPTMKTSPGLVDPFREQGGGFMLLTDVQLEEYILSHRNH